MPETVVRCLWRLAWRAVRSRPYSPLVGMVGSWSFTREAARCWDARRKLQQCDESYWLGQDLRRRVYARGRWERGPDSPKLRFKLGPAQP